MQFVGHYNRCTGGAGKMPQNRTWFRDRGRPIAILQLKYMAVRKFARF